MKLVKKLAPLYLLVIAAFLGLTFLGDRAVTAMTETAPIERRRVFVIDAGHGGMDGGATSCTGVLESQINLEIALRLDDLMHLLGHETVMIRTTDKSVYTQGDTIAAQKVSDLKQRVKIVNTFSPTEGTAALRYFMCQTVKARHWQRSCSQPLSAL